MSSALQYLTNEEGEKTAVIGMRRAGKTSFLHQCLGDLMAQGRNPKNLVYFNFEDERLGGLQVADLHKVVDVHARLFPPSTQEKVGFFFDEIQLVPSLFASRDILWFLDDLIAASVRHASIRRFRPISSDPDDDCMIELALTADVQAVVTHNKPHFKELPARGGLRC